MGDFRAARERVLACLQAAGPKGLTSWELLQAVQHSRAVGRVWELSKQYEIEHVKEGRLHRWIYRGEKPRPSLLELMERGA